MGVEGLVNLDETALNADNGPIMKLQLKIRWHVALHLCNKRSQMMSKCDNNKRVVHEAQLWEKKLEKKLRPYFLYCLSSVHYGEDRFQTHFLNHSSHI